MIETQMQTLQMGRLANAAKKATEYKDVPPDSAHAETRDYPFSVGYLLTDHRDRRANLDLPQEPLMQMRDLQDRDIR